MVIKTMAIYYAQVKEMIEVCGGAVMWEEEIGSVDAKLLANAIRLMTPGEASLLVDTSVKVKNAFHVSYVLKCVKESCIFLNLSHFKVTK